MIVVHNLQRLALLVALTLLTIISSKVDAAFSPSTINPPGPTDAIPSTYSLSQELAAWNNLVLFANLAQFYNLLPAPSNSTNVVLLAPVDNAFLFLAERLDLSTIDPNTADPVALSTALDRILSGFGRGSLIDILSYHIIVGDFDEQELNRRATVATAQGTALRFDLPRITDQDADRDISSVKRRIFRPVNPVNARIMFVNQVLLPYSLDILLNGTGISDGGDRAVDSILPIENSMLQQAFPPNPFVNYLTFVASRADLSILNALLQTVDLPKFFGDFDVTREASHLLAPNNDAFLNLFGALAGDKVEEIDTKNPVPKVLDIAYGIFTVLRGATGVADLTEILQYHIALTNSTVDGLVGGDPIETLFSNASISVSEDGIEDEDPTRAPAKPIATFITLMGQVTVIDSVLLPFNSRVATAVVAANSGPGSTACAREDYKEKDDDSASCFAGDSRVTLASGRSVRMADLQAGDEVLVDAQGTASRVFLFTHRSRQLGKFVELETSSGRTLHVTRGHYVHVEGRLMAAGSVRVGALLDTVDGAEKVVRVGESMRRGVIAPHSLHGDLMVNGVRVSGYTTAVSPRVAHAVLAPVRALVAWAGFSEPLGSLLYGGVADNWLVPMRWVVGGRHSY